MAETIDEILLNWLEETPGVARHERQALLLKELMTVHTMRDLAIHQNTEFLEGSQANNNSYECNEGLHDKMNSLVERETKLCAALRNTLLEIVDVAAIRRVAECLSVSTDLDVLYGALDAHCVMALRILGDGSRQLPQQFRGVDDIINELSEFQESVLLLRVDLSTSPVCSHSSSSAVLPAITVREVSPVQSWIVRCEVELEVGTQLTYYAEADCTKPLFDLRSSFIFSADGAKVEYISRELLPRGGHHLDDLLRSLHFGGFQP